MRRSLLLLLALLCCGVLHEPASAGHGGWFQLGKCWPDAVGRRCCDNYDRKSVPCAKTVHLFGCDDYCRKPVPCARPVSLFGCDDYCRKPVPAPSCPPPLLKCVLGHPAPCTCLRR